jgi:hypothetical protein
VIACHLLGICVRMMVNCMCNQYPEFPDSAEVHLFGVTAPGQYPGRLCTKANKVCVTFMCVS